MMTIFTVLLIAATACGSSEPTPTPIIEGTLSGTVTIGPLCPVEPCNSTTNPFEGLEMVLADPNDLRVLATAQLREDGTFVGTVPVGEYLLNIEPCEFLGCASEVPLRIRVLPGSPTVILIDIDTGIR